MIRLVAALSLLLLSFPAYSAGGDPPPAAPKCSKGKVYSEKTKKCEAPKYGPDLNDKSAYGVIPPGFYVFCKDHPEECRPVEPDILTSDWMPTLEKVNKTVNAAITYKPEGKWEQDIWTVSPKEGDCDDYAATKRQELIKAGVPRGAMRAAYVITAEETDHVFLVVSTVQGEFVLDNGTDEVYPIERAMVLKISIQDAANPERWWQIY
jgi:predicted transglutaminase-like cysteine proteinase